MPETGPIPDVMVELLLLDELAPDEAAEIRACLEATGDPRITALERSNETLLARFPVDTVVAELRAMLGEQQALAASVVVLSGARVWGGALVAAAAGVLLAWGLRDAASGPIEEPASRISMAQHSGSASEGVRHKGVQRLIVYREGSERALDPGDRVSEGDVLQLAYATAGERYGVIVSLDGAGVITLHWPATAEDSTRLGSGVVRLDHAYELDDAPDFERFVFVASHDPLVVDDVMTAAQNLASTADPEHAPMPGPDAWHRVSVGLRKRSHR